MMDEKELLCSKQHKQAHALCLKLERQSEETNALYEAFPLFLEMLDSPISYVRVRGFRLICAQAQWDVEGLIEKNLDKILRELEDEKPTSVRQCLSQLPKMIQYKPELNDQIWIRLKQLDVARYQDSMRPLIIKDVERILNEMENER